MTERLLSVPGGVVVHERPLAPPRGHLTLEIYRGDPERVPLTEAQRAENKLWMEEGILLRGPAGVPERLGIPGEGMCLLPVFAGAIRDFPIDRLDYDNLVLTTGKGLLLDRTFAMGGPPTQANSMGVGATAAAAAVGDVQLGSTPTILAFDALPIRAGLVATCITTFGTAVANISWNELGMFNGVVNGTSIMFNRIAPIGPFQKSSAVSIVGTITVTQS